MLVTRGELMSKVCPHPAWVEVDLARFRKNISLIKSYVGKSLLCLPVKANAYGHGLINIGLEAQKNGVDYLAVAHLNEGAMLRRSGVMIPILVLGAIHEEQIEDLIDYNLEFTISSIFKANLVADICKKLHKRCRVHIEVDTGMQRTGVRASTAISLFNRLKELGCFEIVGIYSHLATADRENDPFAAAQIRHFTELVEHPSIKEANLIRHMANSGGVLFCPEARFDMVRPSLMAFGYIPESCPPDLSGIEPCLSIKAKVSYFKVVEEGAGISYGHTYKTSKQTRIVTIAIGYGDGYRRVLSNKGSVLIRGKKFPIVGAICMDQLMVDIGHEEVFVGDEAVLIGRQGEHEISLKEIALLCDTIPHEVLCFFNDRLPRVYL